MVRHLGSRQKSSPMGKYIVVMAKILQAYLRFFAKIYLRRAKPKIIAITGSVGKTSTKEAIFEVLKIKFGQDIRKSEGNLNNETGVPLAILGYKKSPSKFWHWLAIILGVKFRALFGRKMKVLVLEMAADKPGDIKYLTSFVRPNIACITSIAPAHLAAFGNIDKIVEEKTALLRALPSDGWAILNLDDEKLKKTSLDGQWQTITYAIDEKADICAKNITTEIENYEPLTKFQVEKNGSKFRATLSTLGLVSNVYAALSAVAAGVIFEMTDIEITNGLKNIKASKHRMTVQKGKNGAILIDDSYNANPVSMRAALAVLNFLPQPAEGGRKIAVLGDMLEIGKITDEAHRIIGQYAQEVADEVIAVGNLARKYHTRIHFSGPKEAGDYLLGKINKNDIILIKASRAIGLEKIVEALKVTE